MTISTDNFPIQFNANMTYIGKIGKVYFFQYFEEIYTTNIERPGKNDLVYRLSLENEYKTFHIISDKLNLPKNRIQWYLNNKI